MHYHMLLLYLQQIERKFNPEVHTIRDFFRYNILLFKYSNVNVSDCFILRRAVENYFLLYFFRLSVHINIPFFICLHLYTPRYLWAML
jgi:hypothetical protein